ncbi:MAG TPA: cysteine hydrolase [Burkholderiaceae bacterium]
MSAPPLLPARFEDWCDPRRTALLVYDMQVGVCRQVARSAAVIERCGVALQAARRAGMRIAFTRHRSPPRAWLGATQLRTAMAWQRASSPDDVQSWFARGAPAAEIVPELAPRDDELVVDKFAMSAFEGTPLATAWRDGGLTGVAIAGIALEIGIEPTVRHATDLGLVPIVLADACGAGHAEAGERTLATMRFVGEAVFGDVDGFAAALARTPT